MLTHQSHAGFQIVLIYELMEVKGGGEQLKLYLNCYSEMRRTKLCEETG